MINEGRLYMRFVELEKVFDRVPRNVLERAMRKKGTVEVLVRLLMSLFQEGKTRV